MWCETWIEVRKLWSLCRVSDASGSVEYDEVKVGAISKSDLDSNVCKTISLLYTHFMKYYVTYFWPWLHVKQESRAVAKRKPRDAAAVLFGLKFADNIHYKFKSSQASKARLQSSKHTGAKQNLMQNGHSGSFKLTSFGVSGKAIRD